MTKVEVRSLVSLSSLTFDAIQGLLSGLTLKALAQLQDSIIVTVEEDLTQDQVDDVVDNLRLYLLQNLITGKIIE